MPVVLPDLTLLKLRLNITTATHDAELTDFLAAAVEVVEGYVGPLAAKAVVEVHYAPSGRVLILRESPALSITSVTNANGTTYVAADYALDTASGLLRTAYGKSLWGGEVTVTYQAGRSTLPAALREAILIVAAHLWETQRGVSPSPFSPEEQIPTSRGFAVPNRAVELMRPYIVDSVGVA